MLSVPLILRHFEHGRHEHLLEAIAANGMALPLTLRVRLSQLPGAAVALGLRRLVELTYGPTHLSRDMIAWLLQRQAPDGGIDGDVLATAAAAAALGRVLRDHLPANGDIAGTIAAAHERAVAFVAAHQDDAGLIANTGERDTGDRMLATLFVLYILSEDELFRATSRYALAMDHFEQHASELRGGVADLWDLVCITTCGNPTGALPRGVAYPAPAMAAIAA